MTRSHFPAQIPAPLLLLAAATAWGISNVVQKGVLDKVGPLTTLGFSCLVAALALFPMARRESRAAETKSIVPMVHFALPVAFFTVALLSFQVGIGGTSVGNASFMIECCTAITPFAAWFILREKITSRILIPAAITVWGLFLLGGGMKIGSIAWGDGVCLLSAMCFSFSIPLNSLFLRNFARPALLSTVQFAGCGLICSGLGLVFESTSLNKLVQAWPDILFLGFISKALPYFLMAKAQQKVCAGLANLIVGAEAPIGAVAAYVLVGETMGTVPMLGAALVIFAIVSPELSTLCTMAKRTFFLDTKSYHPQLA